MSKREQRPVTVYVVDDDEAVRKSTAALIRSVGYACRPYASAEEFLGDYDVSDPGCLILDVRMPVMSGVELQHRLIERGAFLPIIFLTGHADVPMTAKAMKEGAFDFLEKPFRDQELLDSVNNALKFDAGNRLSVAQAEELRHRYATLTPREHSVMELIVSGRANKVIAMDLGLSERTVEIHRARVMEKMAAQSVAHLVKMSILLSAKPQAPREPAAAGK